MGGFWGGHNGLWSKHEVASDEAVIPQLAMVGELAGASREAGARFAKFEYGIGSTPNLNNDFPVFRYTDAIMSKAEALWRQNPGSGEALNLVNQVRARAGVAPFGSLTAENHLAERDREFYTVMWRRQDLILFFGSNYKYIAYSFE